MCVYCVCIFNYFEFYYRVFCELKQWLLDVFLDQLIYLAIGEHQVSGSPISHISENRLHQACQNSCTVFGLSQPSGSQGITKLFAAA